MQQLRLRQQRPYWHVDAKWIFGILAAILLTVTLLLYNLSRVTGREIGPKVSAGILASIFTRDNEFNEDKTIEELKKEFARTKKDEIKPIPNLPLVITRQDVETLRASELKIKFFSQITEPIYEQGVEHAARQFLEDPKEHEEFAKQASVLNFFTHDMHERLTFWFRLSLGITIFTLLTVVYFSWRWGRLANPGSIMFLAGLPVILVASAVSRAAKDEGGDFLESLGPEVAPFLVASVRLSYLTTTVTGIALIILAGFGRVLFSRKERKKAR